MRKMIALMSAAAVFLSGVSCGKKKNSEPDVESEPVSFEAAELGDISYKKTKLKLPDEIRAIYCFEPYNGGHNFMLLGTGENTPEFWNGNADLSEVTHFDIPDFAVMKSYYVSAADDGTIVEFINYADYGDLPMPSISDGYKSYYDNQQEYDEAAEYSFRIITYALDGEKLDEVVVSGFETEPNEGTEIRCACANGELVAADIDGVYNIFSSGGKYISALEPENGYIEQIGRDSDNNIVCAVRTEDYKLQLCRIDSGGKLIPGNIYDISDSLTGKIIPGTGSYSMYIVGKSTIYGINSDDGKLEALFSLKSAAVADSQYIGFTIADDGDFIIAAYGKSGIAPELRKYTACDPSELENIPVITIGTWSNGWEMPEFVEYINDNCSDFRVVLKEYYEKPSGRGEDSYEKAEKISHDKLMEDADKGELPDIFITDVRGNFGNLNLIQKDLLDDLDRYMENDDTLTSDKIIPSVLKGVRTANGGKVRILPRTFGVRMQNTAKAKHLQDVGKWDTDEYIRVMENPPETLKEKPEFIQERERSTKKSRFMHWNWWFDEDDLECHFDTASFVRFLEYCNRGEPDSDQPYYYTQPSEEEAIQEANYYSRRIIDDYELFDDLVIGSYGAYIREMRGTFNNEPVITLGSPSIDGQQHPYELSFSNDCLSINKKSTQKDVAWECLKYFFSDEFSGQFISYEKVDSNGYTGRSYGGFPITKSGLEMTAKNEIKNSNSNDYSHWVDDDPNNGFGEEWRDYHGMELTRTGVDGKSENIMLGSIEEEDVKEVNDIIENAWYSPVYSINDLGGDRDAVNELYNIPDEEAQRYFNGEVSAEQCAEVLQDRLSTYLSEKYG